VNSRDGSFDGVALGAVFDRAQLVLGGNSVLCGVRWTIAPGERWILEGANGAGKTQVCKLLAGERWPTPTPTATVTTRRARKDHGQGDGLRWTDAAGHDVDALEALPRIVHVSSEHQDRYARRDWNLKLRELIGTGFDRSDIPLRKLTRVESAVVTRAVRAFGLQALERRRLLSLSYGERRRVLLARAWVARPALLLLDEPLNGLDAKNRRQVQAALRVLLRRRCTVVLTTHRAGELLPGFAHLARMVRGRVVVANPCASLVAKVGARGLVTRTAASVGARGLATKPASPAGAVSLPPPVLLALHQVDLYREWRLVLRGLDWTLHRGEQWAVVGATGSGKSTLLQLLHGTRWPAFGGSVQRAGHPAGTPIDDWKLRVGYVSPELQTLAVDDAMGAGSLRDLVVGGWRGSLGLDWPATPRERQRAQRALEAVGLGALAERYPREVSYGQLRLALLARALVRDPELLILDEPFTGLDAPTRERLRQEIERRVAAGTTLVMAVHHAGDLPGGTMRRLELRRGRVYFSPLR
jgi:molybdate transport system ATP-binding protein